MSPFNNFAPNMLNFIQFLTVLKQHFIRGFVSNLLINKLNNN